jgi:hypothetical protein
MSNSFSICNNPNHIQKNPLKCDFSLWKVQSLPKVLAFPYTSINLKKVEGF